MKYPGLGRVGLPRLFAKRSEIRQPIDILNLAWIARLPAMRTLRKFMAYQYRRGIVRAAFGL